jgi:hypothetical protein
MADRDVIADRDRNVITSDTKCIVFVFTDEDGIEIEIAVTHAKDRLSIVSPTNDSLAVLPRGKTCIEVIPMVSIVALGQ